MKSGHGYAIALILMLLLSACSGAKVSAPRTVKLAVSASDTGFSPTELRVNKGDTVEVTVTNMDQPEPGEEKEATPSDEPEGGGHGFALPEFGVSLSSIKDGESKTATFVADKAGTFEFFCNTYCGDIHDKMKGKLIVEG